MAIDDLKRIVSSILKTLECPICLELLNNPVSTSCNHRFCKNCIITALNEKFKIPCPLCKCRVTKRQLQDVSQLSDVISVVKRLVQTVHEDIKNEEENLNKCIIPPSRKENDSPKSFNLSKRKRGKDQNEAKMNKVPKITHNKRGNLNDRIFIDNESINSSIEPKISTNANIRNALKRITRRTNSYTMEKYFDQNLKKPNLETGNKNNQNDKSLRTSHSKENVFCNYSPSSTRNKKEQIKNISLRHTLPKRRCSKKILHEDSSSSCFPEVIFKRSNNQTKLAKIKSNSKANENSIENQDPKNQNNASFNLNKSITYSQGQMKIFKTKNVLPDSAKNSQSKIEGTDDPYMFISSQNSPKLQKKKKRKSKNFIEAQIKPVFQKLDEDSSNILNNKSVGGDESSCNSSVTEDIANCKNLFELNKDNQTAVNISDENSNKNEDCDLFLTPALNIKQLKIKKKKSFENTSTIETRSAKKRKRNSKDETFFIAKENISDWIEEISEAEKFNLCIKCNKNGEDKSLNSQNSQQESNKKERDNEAFPSTIKETQEHINDKNLDHFELVKEKINKSILEKEGSKQLENDKTEQLVNFPIQENNIHINSQADSVVSKIETSITKINNEISSSFQKNEQSTDSKIDNQTNDDDDILIHDELPSLENSLMHKSSDSSNNKNHNSLDGNLNNKEYINKKNIEINAIEESKDADKSDNFSHKFENIKSKQIEISTIDDQKISSTVPEKIIIIEESFPLSVIPNTSLSITSKDQQSMETKDKFINININKQIEKQNDFTNGINSVNDCNKTDITICDLNNIIKDNDNESQSEKDLYDQDINYKKPKRKTFCLEIETQDLNDLAEHRNTLDLLTEVCMEFANSSNKSDKSKKQNLSDKTLDKLNQTDNSSKLTQETNYLDKNSYQKHESQDEKFGSGNLSDQLSKSFSKNIYEDKVYELHDDPQIQDDYKHSSVMPLSLECVKSSISKSAENDQTVDISIPINIITETAEAEIKNIITFSCSECQCKIDLKKTEHNLIISFIKSKKRVYKTSDKSVGTEDTIDNLNENFQINTSTDSEDHLAYISKKIPENESIKNEKYHSLTCEIIEVDREQIQNNQDDNSQISSQTISGDLPEIKNSTPENVSLEKTCDENDINKERIYGSQCDNSKIFSQMIENNLPNLNNEQSQTVPIEENEIHKEESCSVIDKFQNDTSVENSEDLLAELHQEISKTISLKENCNVNEDDKEKFQNNNDKFEINVSTTNLDCNETDKQRSENVLLREKCDENKIDNCNNSKISSEIIKVNDEISETFIPSNQEEPLLFHTMVSTKCTNHSENSQNKLSDTKLNLHKIETLFTEEEILCENKKVIDDEINQETPNEINYIACQKNNEINSSNKNLEKYLKEMSCPSSDPDMIFAESLIAPLKNLQYSKQNQSSSEINSNKQIHQFDVNLSVSESKNEIVQNMKKNKIAEIINHDDNCSSKTLNDAKKVENKINDSSKKESFSSKVTSHLSNGLKNKFNALNDTETQNTSSCSEKSSKRRKNFQRIKNYLSESDSESSSEDLQDIIESSKHDDDTTGRSQKNQNVTPSSRKQQIKTPSRKKEKKNEVNQVSPIIYSVDNESAEYIHQSEIQEKIRLEIEQMKEQIRQMEIQLQTSVCEDANKSFNKYSEEEPHNVDSDSEEESDDLFSPIPPTP